MTWEQTVAMLALLTVGLLTPGPDFLLVVRNALASRRQGLATVGGIVVGLSVQNAVLAAGFGLLVGHPEVMALFQALGGAVLVWMAVRVFRGWQALRHADTAGLPEAEGSVRRGFLEGLLCNLTNPKAFLFFASLHAGGGPAAGASAEVLGGLIVAHASVCWSVVVLLVQAPPVRSRLQRIQVHLLLAFAVLLVTLGALALARGLHALFAFG